MNQSRRLFFLFALPMLVVSGLDDAKWQGPDQPVYVVTRNHYAEGFVEQGPTAKFGDLIAIEIFNPQPRPANQDAIYSIGERLALFVGGQKQGSVTITKVMPLQCDSSAAMVAGDPSFHLEEHAMALATNSARVRSHANAQRQPTEGERKSAQELALVEFRKNGYSAASSRDIEFDQLVVTHLDQSGDNYLIGFLFVEARGVRHELFLVASLSASGSVAELARYHRTTDLQDGTDVDGMRFVDQLDLDGDETDEIVIEMTGYESEAFGIYKRQNHHWTQVHVGGGGGCCPAVAGDSASHNPASLDLPAISLRGGADEPARTLRQNAAFEGSEHPVLVDLIQRRSLVLSIRPCHRRRRCLPRVPSERQGGPRLAQSRWPSRKLVGPGHRQRQA